MELQTILDRYAEAIESIDRRPPTPGQNRRTQTSYHPGFLSLDERVAIRSIDETWTFLHPNELRVHRYEVPYPSTVGLNDRTTKLDHMIDTRPTAEGPTEWGIEVKRLQSVGDNGGVNDFVTTKVLSPYLKDRGMLHDALRLREYGFTNRVAVIGYGFSYTENSLEEARLRFQDPSELAVIKKIATSVARSGPMTLDPLVEFADAILRLRGYTRGPRAQQTFTAWTHPAGGHGLLFGWEIRRPREEAGFDPRHPW